MLMKFQVEMENVDCQRYKINRISTE